MSFPFSFWGASPYLLRANMSGLTPGTMSASAFLAATGLTYTRDTFTPGGTSLGATVQTSASTLTFDNAADRVCIGNAGFGVGAVCQPKIRNFANVANTRNINTAGYTGAVASTYPYLTSPGPDGLFLANHISGANNNVSNYMSFGSASPASRNFCASEWLQPTPGGTGNPVQLATLRFNSGTPTLVAYGTATPPSTWQRQALALDSWDTAAFFPVDGTTEIGNGGIGAGSRDMLFDCMQIDGNDFASEYIDGGNANSLRDRDRFSWASGFVAADGSISLYLKFIAKHATTHKPYIDATSLAGQSKQTYQYLCRLGTTAYARINVDSGTAWHLEVFHNGDGAAVESSGAISFARGDIVECFVKFGGGAATVAKWRVNAGSWTLWGLTATFSAISAGADVLSICGGDPGAGNDPHTALWGWIQEAAIYKSGLRPSGA